MGRLGTWLQRQSLAQLGTLGHEGPSSAMMPGATEQEALWGVLGSMAVLATLASWRALYAAPWPLLGPPWCHTLSLRLCQRPPPLHL